MDRSKSVGKDNFITVKNALKSFVDNFNITPETTHVSLIFFAGEALHLFNLTDPKYQSNRAVKKAIDSVPDKLYWGTRTDLALMKAHDHLFQRGQDRRKRPNALVVFTDGKSSPKSAPYSETVPPLEVQLCECRLLVFRLIVSITALKIRHQWYKWYRRPVSSVEREVVGSSPDRTNTQGL